MRLMPKILQNVEHRREPLLEFRIGPRVIDDRTDYMKKTMIQTSQVYEVNLNKDQP